MNDRFNSRTMNKISLSLLLLFIGLVPMWAQSVSFSSGGADGKTLVVTASGDLTSYSATSTTMSFTSSAASKIYYQPNPSNSNWNVNVAAGEAYAESREYFYYGENWAKVIATKEYLMANNYIASSILSFSDLVSGQMTAGGYTSIKFVQDANHTDKIVLSKDQMQTILNNDKLNAANSLVDFADVNVGKDVVSQLTAGTMAPSWVLPSSLSDDEALAYAETQTQGGNIYWYANNSDDGTKVDENLSVKVLNDGKLSSVDAAKTDKSKNIVVYGTVGNYEKAKSFDIAGIENLDLHHATVNENPTPATFAGWQNVKSVLLKGIDPSAWTIPAGGYTSSVQVFKSIVTKGTDTVLEIKQLTAGHLGDVTNLYNKDFDQVLCVDIFGPVDGADFEYFDGVDTKRLNISHVTYPDNFTKEDQDAAINQIKNNHVEYIALPATASAVTDPHFTKMKENMPGLKGVSHFNTSDHTFTAQTWTDRGGITILSLMMESVTNQTSNIEHLKISGPVNAEDLGSGTKVDANGHLVYTITESDPMPGETKDPMKSKDITPDESKSVRQHGAFTYSNIKTADLSGAAIDPEYPNDMCFAAIGRAWGTSLTHIDLPRQAKEIPVGAFKNLGSLTEICIPQNYEIIRSGAFQNNNNLTKITTTETKNGEEVEKTIMKWNAETNEDEASDNYMVFSPNIKLIETGAFGNVTKMKDVYFLGEEAPEVQRWAFNTTMTYGNSGFNKTSSIITRENYMNGTMPMAMLHFPSTITKEQIAKYTDPTRDYSIADGKALTDGNGHLVFWPNQSEFIRSYEQGHTGYTWKAWDNSREAWTNSVATAGKGMGIMQTDGDNMFTANGSPAGTQFYTPGQKDYRGLHEFALVGSYNYETTIPQESFAHVSDNNWWTEVVPYNLTYNNLHKLFGQNAEDAEDGKVHEPIICMFTGVERNVGNGSITLKFGPNLMEGKSGNDIVMEAGKPYMIKPNMKFATTDGSRDPNWNPNDEIHRLGHNEILKNGSTTEFGYTAPEAGVDAILYNEGSVNEDISPAYEAVVKNGEEADKYWYRLIGSFSKWYLPQYGYFFSWLKGSNLPSWYWKKDVASTKRNWNPYTCVILVTKNGHNGPTFTTSAGAWESSHWNIYTNNNTKSYCDDDSFSEQSGAKANNFVAEMVFGAENVTSGMNNIRYDFSKADPSSATPIYNISGQMVSKTGDTTGLAKGIYIQGGKKFVVK